MKKDDLVYIGHMIEAAQSIRAKVRAIGRQEFDRDENLRLALVHLVQIIGEAACHVSKEYQDAHPEIPWHVIIGMRHKVVHDYFQVDYDIMWDVVTGDIPQLLDMLEKLIE